MTLFAEYNSPYLFAIAFVFFIGVLEMISLIFGHFLSGALDAHLDHYDALSSGPAGRASLSEYWTRSRPVVLCLLAGYFGLFGILIQHGGIMLWQAPLSNLLLVPLSIVLSVFAVHYSGKSSRPGYPEMKAPPSGKRNLSAAWRLLPATPPSPVHLAKENLPISSARFTIYCWNPKREKNLKRRQGADCLPTFRNALFG